MQNSLDLDQARRSVGPDLGPNCLPRSAADNKIRVNYHRGRCKKKSILPKMMRKVVC